MSEYYGMRTTCKGSCGVCNTFIAVWRPFRIDAAAGLLCTAHPVADTADEARLLAGSAEPQPRPRRFSQCTHDVLPA
uniref:DUF3795 domain-containing protein n=1 Tax=Ascaris lumbricoides TaxID=6252 RepID=A0A0M3HNZ9_ASCLU